MRHSFKSEEVNGVLTAVNTGGPKYSEELFIYKLVVEIQQDENLPESLLQSSVTFTMGEDRCFYVEDNWSCRIAVFDPQGLYVRSIGREGNGPGEFSKYYWELRDLREDVLDIFDSAQRRATRYRTDGTLLEVIKFPQDIVEAAALQTLEGLVWSRQHLTPEGSWVIIGRVFEINEDIRSTGIRFITITADLDSLGAAETYKVPNNYQFMMRARTGQEFPTYGPMPFAPDPEAVYVPDRGILMTTGAEPTLQWYRLDGKSLRTIYLDLPPVPVSSEEKAGYIEFREKQVEEQKSEDMKQFLRSQLKGLKFPEFKAYWSSVTVDDAGYIWLGISESIEDREQMGGYAYRVLCPEGEYLGITRSSHRGHVVRGHFLAVVTDPDTDEEIPTVWRLVPQTAGFRYP